MESIDTTPGFIATLLLGSPATNTFTIPAFVGYQGAHLVAQSVSFNATANPFGLVTSNALALFLDNQ